MNPLLSRALHTYWRFSRGLTGGVRGLVLDGSNVLLVRHSYMTGLHLPGGGVEVGETFEDALARELREEAGVRLRSRPELFGLYLNRTVTRRDHVALYIVRDFEREAFTPSREIVEAAFHPLDTLPEAVTEGTRRRIAEAREGKKAAFYW